MSEKFQAVVIGGGPGGYVCAIRLAQLGLKTACIESRGSLGGTCLNIGCIPSKSLLNLSEEFHKVKGLANKGIEIGEVKLNLDKMMKSKDKAVTVLTKGVEFLLKKNKVTYFKGHGSFKSKNEILIKDDQKKETIIQTEKTVIATGSVPVSLPGIEIDEKNRIITDKKFKTNVENIYAIGDVIVGPMLAHKAEDEGIAVAENIVGQSGHVNYDTIPGVVYTSPEVASIGKTEEQLKELNKSYKVGKFSFMANSRAKAIDDAEGFVKILADAETDKVLGAHIIGPHAGELIAEIGVAMEFGASAEDIARTCHAHPTFSEAVKEAALSVDKRAIHS